MIMEVNNFKLVEDQLTFNNPDEFYFVQVLMRGKDGNTQPGINGNNKNRQLSAYYITSKEKLEDKKDEIITLCKLKNARCYIHPTKRSFKQVAIKALVLTADIIEKENYMGMRGIYTTACGQSFIPEDKKFIVDVDKLEDESRNDLETRAMNMTCYMRDECEPLGKEKVLYTVPTKNGLHLITLPFNTARFGEQYTNVDVHKNNPTLLYYSYTSFGAVQDINDVFPYLDFESKDPVCHKVLVELRDKSTVQAALDYNPYEETTDYKNIDHDKEIDKSSIDRVWTLDKTNLLWSKPSLDYSRH